MTTPMILTAQVPNHRQDHWGHHFITSLRAQAIRNNLTRDRDTIAVVSEIGIWFPDFGSKNYLSILPIVVTNWAICTACKFQECFRMIHVEIYTGNCFLDRKNHDLYFSRAAFIPAGSNSNEKMFFSRALIGSSTASNGITIFLKIMQVHSAVDCFWFDCLWNPASSEKKGTRGKNSFQMIIFRSFLCVRSRNPGGSISWVPIMWTQLR